MAKTLLDIMEGTDGVQEQEQEKEGASEQEVTQEQPATTLDALVSQNQADLQAKYDEQQAQAEAEATADVMSNFVQEDIAKAEEAAANGESYVTEQYFSRDRRVNTPNVSIFG